MSAGAFLEKERRPSKQSVVSLLGKAQSSWADLAKWVVEKYSVKGEWKFYGKRYGWAMRFRIGGKALVSLYPNEGFFTAQVILSPSMVETTQSMKLGKKTLGTISQAHPYPEGRWIFLKVTSASGGADIKKLLLLKSPRS